MTLMQDDYMSDNPIINVVNDAIADATGTPFITKKIRSVSGGDINVASIITSENRSFFLKTNTSAYDDMFSAEFDGLVELRKASLIKAPEPICYGEAKAQTFLVLENMMLGGGDKISGSVFGRQLACLHQVTANQFGWFRNNRIGSTRQINNYSNTWIDFYRENRLQYQLSLAAEQGFKGELQQLGDRLCENLDVFFSNYQPYPSLLHGDLWSGNFGYCVTHGEPVIFDPAVYYGDRETDIAMTELFGGFPVSFYEAYEEVLPLDEGYVVRKDLYNLYHMLNHLNLFGRGYYARSISLIKQLLSQV